MKYFFIMALLLSQVASAQVTPAERYRILHNDGNALLLDTQRGYVWQQTLCPEHADEKIMEQLDNCWMKMVFLDGTPQQLEETLNKLEVKAKVVVPTKRPVPRRR